MAELKSRSRRRHRVAAPLLPGARHDLARPHERIRPAAEAVPRLLPRARPVGAAARPAAGRGDRGAARDASSSSPMRRSVMPSASSTGWALPRCSRRSTTSRHAAMCRSPIRRDIARSSPSARHRRRARGDDRGHPAQPRARGGARHDHDLAARRPARRRTPPEPTTSTTRWTILPSFLAAIAPGGE